jgi:LuxR family transcriptional regulator, quorum-sensing system regulator CciR
MPRANGEFWLLLDQITRARGIEQLRAAIMGSLAAVGFHAAYFVAPVSIDRQVGRQFFNIGFPLSWQRRYRERFRLVDPLPDLALRYERVFRWSDVMALPELTPEEIRYVRLMARYSRVDGVGVGCFGPQARSGFMAAGRPADRDALRYTNLLRVQTIGQMSFLRYAELVRPFDTEAPALSRREMDVMRWLAGGKSNSVIAEILGIQKSSVDVYVRRIFDKLGVSDRTTASVRALALGLIVEGPPDTLPSQAG